MPRAHHRDRHEERVLQRVAAMGRLEPPSRQARFGPQWLSALVLGGFCAAAKRHHWVHLANPRLEVLQLLA